MFNRIKEAAMPVFLQNDLVLLLLKVYGALFLLGPIVLRATFKFKAKLDPQFVSLESLPPDVGQFMKPRVAAIAGLGFEPVGYINLGTMAGSTQSFMALLNNSRTLEWADVSVAKTTKQMRGYSEFITRCSDDAQVDTNTSATPPVLSPWPAYHVFRFPQIKDAFTLYRVHRMLVQQNTGGSRPELPPKGQELAELKRRLERYGVRQQERGYMYLDPTGEYFRLTWKGAVLGAWRSIWPISLFRSLLMQGQSQTRLRSLGVAQARST
jgi:hypothetical protein